MTCELKFITMGRDRGYTLRLAGRVWRITIPPRRCRFARDGKDLSLGWVIIRRLRGSGGAA